MIISLTGFMGCGKSSVGRELSTLLDCSYIDLDSYIEERTGRRIPEIFATDGEAEFRRMETENLMHLITQVKDQNMVLSLGGGTIMTECNAEIAHDKTLCIYLRASVSTLVEHLEGETHGRPMLKSEDGDDSKEALEKRISGLMALRASTYEKTAHIIVDIDGKSVEEICQIISSRSCISLIRN